MTIFAGAVAIDRGSIPIEAIETLRGALSRHPGDEPRMHRGEGWTVVQLVLPTEIHPCEFVDEVGSATFLAGRPLIGAGARPEIEALHAALRDEDRSVLQRARGSFCALHVDARARRVWLVADKLGLRPIYFGLRDGCVFFSTALRTLEKVRGLARIDVRGVSEIASFGYPLGERSPYEGIRTLQPAEIACAGPQGVHSQAYWQWDRLAPSRVSDAELPRVLYQVFMQAVDLRLGAARAAVAGLSGGLDSRCVVAALRGRGVDVHTVNFAPAGTEDQAMGRMAAQALGAKHFEFPTGPLDFWDRMHASHRAWLEGLPTAERPARAHDLWSGDGGSCGIGHIYLDENILALMRQDRTDEAIDRYLKLNGIGLPARLLARGERERLVGYPHEGMRAELERLKGVEPGRRMHLCLVLNGQRRQHANHYENIDLRRFELHTPFFDSELLQLVLTSPIDGFLRHRFYSRWLAMFQPETLAAPWQHYPGHDPCPLPGPTGLRNQWRNWHDRQASEEVARRNVELAGQVLQDPHFPRHLFRRHVLWLARRLTSLGLGDYAHVIKCAATFTRYSNPY